MDAAQITKSQQLYEITTLYSCAMDRMRSALSVVATGSMSAAEAIDLIRREIDSVEAAVVATNDRVDPATA